MKTLDNGYVASEIIKKGQTLIISGNSLVQWFSEGVQQGSNRNSTGQTVGPFGIDMTVKINALGPVTYDIDNDDFFSNMVSTKLYVNPDSGSDARGSRGRKERPFKTLNMAVSRAIKNDIIECEMGSNNLNGSFTSLTIDVPMKIVGGNWYNGSHNISNCPVTITIDTTDNSAAVFSGIQFSISSGTDAPCISINMTNSHEVEIRNCFITNTFGSKVAIATSGVWPISASGNISPVRLRDNCFLGRIVHNAGIVGQPLDKQGIMTIEASRRFFNIATYSGQIECNSGFLLITGSIGCPVILNGGCVEIERIRSNFTLTSDTLITCPDVDTVGKSILLLSDFNQFGLYRNLTDPYPAISVGNKVVYHIDGDMIDSTRININAGAVKLRNYLISNGRNALIPYNSSSTA